MAEEKTALVKFVQDHEHDNQKYQAGEVATLPAPQVESLVKLGFGEEATEDDLRAWEVKKAKQEEQSTNEQEDENA